MNSSFSTYWRGMASGRDQQLAARFMRLVLCIPSLLYGCGQWMRAGLFRYGVLEAKRLPKPVISVGNITVGGTGKTPVTAMVAGMLLDQGLKVAVLSRGYGGSCEGQARIVSDGKDILLSARECGDEPFLLASTIPGLMVVMGADRHAAGLLAMERLQPDLFLLDDGFQHLRLQRDLNILLLDYARPFGNGCCLPAGLLREPRLAAARADLVIHTRCPVAATSKTHIPGKPNCSARHFLTDLVPIDGGKSLRFEDLRGLKVLACAGIAEPDSFFDDLRGQGVILATTLSFPDHASYDVASMNHIATTFRDCGADLLLTTEKDGVKLSALPHDLLDKTMLCRLALQLDDPVPLADALRNLLQK